MCWPDLGSEPQELAITRKWGKGEIGKQGSTIVRTVELHYPPPLSKFFQKLQSDANLQSTESKRCCPVSDSYWVKPKTYIVDIPKGKSYIDATALLLSLLETCQKAILFLSLARNEDNHSVSFRYTKEFKSKRFAKLFKFTISNINLRLSIQKWNLLSKFMDVMIRRVNWHWFHQIEIKCVWNENISLSFISLNVGYIIDTNWEWISSTGRQNHQLSAWTLKSTLKWYFKISLKFTLCISKHAWASPAFHAYVHDTKMWTVWYDSHSQYRDTSSSPRFHCFQQRLTIAKNRV